MPVLAWASDEAAVTVEIADPFIELHTGPAQAYPIFHVIDRGERVVIIKQQTQWYKIRSRDGVEGWASRGQMERTLSADGEQIELAELDQAAFLDRRWEVGVLTGELADAPITSLYGGYAFTKNFSSELSLGHSVGSVSSSLIYKANLLMQPFPNWEYSPFFTLGVGRITVDPKATLIEPNDKESEISQIGFGVKKYLSRRFVLRFEASEYIVYSASNDKDDNEDISEWKIGFAVFF